MEQVLLDPSSWLAKSRPGMSDSSLPKGNARVRTMACAQSHSSSKQLIHKKRASASLLTLGKWFTSLRRNTLERARQRQLPPLARRKGRHVFGHRLDAAPLPDSFQKQPI